MSLIGKILSATIAEMTNHSDYLLQKAIAAGGLISLPLSLLANMWERFASTSEASAVSETSSVSAQSMTLPECAAIISMVLGLCGIIQIIVNVYYKIKNGGKS